MMSGKLKQFKDSYKMHVFNSYRFKDDCYQFYRANGQGYIDFGDISTGEFPNLIFKMKIKVPINNSFVGTEDIFAYQVRVATAGIYVTIVPSLSINCGIYNGTGTNIVTHSLATYDGQIAELTVKFCQNETSIESNLAGKSFGTYEAPQYSGTRKTAVGKLGTFNRISNIIEAWDYQIFESDANANEVALIADWKLNGNANDDSGNNYNGILTNWLPENWGSSCE